MQAQTRIFGIVAVILAAMLWGTTGTLQALLPAAREPLVVGALRLLIGAVSLMALALATPASRQSFGQLPLRGVVFAGIAIGIYNLLFFAAVSLAGVGIGTAITIGSAPIWVTVYDVLIRRVRPGPLRLFAQGVAIAGAGLLVVDGAGQGGSIPGLALAAMAGASYAAYAVATGRIGQSAPSATIAAATFGVAAVVAAPAFVLLPVAWVFDPVAWPVLLALGVLSTGVAYALYTWGLGRVTASTAVTLSLVEPLTAWALAITVVGEEITAPKLIGAGMVFLGLALVTIRPAR